MKKQHDYIHEFNMMHRYFSQDTLYTIFRDRYSTKLLMSSENHLLPCSFLIVFLAQINPFGVLIRFKIFLKFIWDYLDFRSPRTGFSEELLLATENQEYRKWHEAGELY